MIVRGADAELAGVHAPVQNGLCVPDRGEALGPGALGFGAKGALQTKHKIRRGDGGGRVLILVGVPGQPVFEVEGVGLSIGGTLVAFGAFRLGRAVFIPAEQPAEQVGHGDHFRAFAGQLGVEVFGHVLHLPGEAVQAAAAAGKAERKGKGDSPGRQTPGEAGKSSTEHRVSP